MAKQFCGDMTDDVFEEKLDGAQVETDEISFSNSNLNAGYKVYLKKYGKVVTMSTTLRVNSEKTALTINDVIATIPEKYRPMSTLSILSIGGAYHSLNASPILVVVNNNGIISISSVSNDMDKDKYYEVGATWLTA